MVRLILFVLATLAASSRPSFAGNEPAMAPAPGWVRAVESAAVDPQRRNDAVQLLLVNTQTRYSANSDEHFFELVQHIGSAQGLQAMANIALEWQPENSDLIVHRVQIRRGSETIDLLANGSRFTVLRRENNLEAAVLDGVLTAIMQPEGMAVGDTLVIAYSIRRRAGLLPLRGENLLMLPPNFRARRVFSRDVWSAERRMRWRATESYGAARERRSNGETEIVVSRDNVEGSQIIEGAPYRFAAATFYQVTEFADWGEISVLLHPFYARAATITAGSALDREVARIAALSPDPAVRAIAALRSVQEQVRYFALVMGDGNYLPASAEQTWTRRYGDCKAKTALLLAMLDRLGVSAEGVAVSTIPGDPLDIRLPQLRQFNHILVRANIGGQNYWLDGTRQGDRDLRPLANTVHGFGLPLRSAGAALEPIAPQMPLLPQSEVITTYDASAGFDSSSPLRVAVSFFGEVANQFRALISQAGVERVREQLRAQAPAEFNVTSVEIQDDDASGRLTLTSTGSKQLRWEPIPGASGRRLRFDNEVISWSPDFERPADQDQNAPFALPYPVYLSSTEVVILPNGGRGFTIDGTNLQREVAGTEIRRELSIENGRAIARSVFRRGVPEISAEAAREALPRLREINADRAFIRASAMASIDAGALRRPAATQAATPVASSATATSADVRQLNQSGYEKLQIGRHRSALEDFDRAIALSPQWSLLHANRAIALSWLNRLDDAEAAANQAIRLKEDDAIAHQAMAMIMVRRARYEEALVSADRSIELDGDAIFTHGMRGEILQRLGLWEDALGAFDQVLRQEPGHALARHLRALLLAQLGRSEEAVEAMASAVAADGDNHFLHEAQGDLLRAVGRTEAANAAYAEALRIVQVQGPALADVGVDQDQVDVERSRLLSLLGRHSEALSILDAGLRRQSDNKMLLISRCYVRIHQGTDVVRGVRDCSQALEYDSEHAEAMLFRGLGKLRLQQWAAARADFEAVVGWEPENQVALYGRGLARLNAGDAAGGRADVERALRHDLSSQSPFLQLGFPRLATPLAGGGAAEG